MARPRAARPHRARAVTRCELPRTVPGCNAAPGTQRGPGWRSPHRAGREARRGLAPRRPSAPCARRHPVRASTHRAPPQRRAKRPRPHRPTDRAPCRTGGTSRPGPAPPVRTVPTSSPGAHFHAPCPAATPHQAAETAPSDRPCIVPDGRHVAARPRASRPHRAHVGTRCALPRTVPGRNTAPSTQRGPSQRSPHRAGREARRSPAPRLPSAPCARRHPVRASTHRARLQRRTKRPRPHRPTDPAPCRTGGTSRPGTAPPVRTVRASSPGARFHAPCPAATQHQARNAARASEARTVPAQAGTPPG
ncbi:hypothetical protein QF011_002287 [Curtobacterium flaccumfaciens]|nr:hypothetical protein [Curtobacterium flaccumfaciens]